ncbi:50S ribosomal protein L25/general stress protein Ctc [uncultured Hoeflea sp.]|uniref:50S ribosomal protein L25/general stress protein Ctc n=1 Tax=uncultured Hoeflea sp. TaxID=538666 RepID=UPI00262D7500|nr:50S ribosomal protein L25/general stress protein Ctc [uncultured Hoeflea sp.]
MSNASYELKAEARERVGKGSARELRRNGLIPAVIYGDKKDPVSIALSRKDVTLKIHSGGFMTTLATIDVDGTKYNVLPKDYQLDPVRDFLMHVDFLRISKNTQVTVEIPVHFENEEKSPGIKRGGVLNVVRHTVECNCPANSIPEALIVDLTGLEVGDGVHISAVTLPEGVEPTITDRDFTIATVAAPAGLKSDDNASDEDGAEEAAQDEGDSESQD